MIRETVRSEMVMPSIFSSPWIRGARQSGLAVAIRSISWRISTAVTGRPGRRRCDVDNLAQNLRNRSRCHRVIVSGWTYTNGLRQPEHHWRSAIQNIRSKAVRTGRFRFRWKAASWRRSAAFSRAMVW